MLNFCAILVAVSQLIVVWFCFMAVRSLGGLATGTIRSRSWHTISRATFCVLVAAMMFATFKGGAKLRSPNGEATSCRFSNEGNGAANENPEGSDVAAIWSIAVDSGTASTEAGVHLTLHRPTAGSDSVEAVTLCACTDLAEGDWFALSNTVFAAGETNLAIHVPSAQLANHSISNRCFFSFFTSGDTDGDGLEDWYELLISHTHPNDADTDGDRMPDGWEVEHGLDPLSDSDATEDDDHDGVVNWHEWMFGSDPHSGDTDGDHISDWSEIENGTNPASADTDNDGLDDESENDRPGSGTNGQDDHVNGRGDLLDFTPVLLDLSGVFPPGTPDSFKARLTWKLQSFVVNAVWTSLSASNAGSFLRTNCGATFGPNLSQNAHEATVDVISSAKKLPDAFAQVMEANDGKGVVMIEGRGSGHSLWLQAYVDESVDESSEPFIEGSLYLEVSSVEDMYWFYSLYGAESDLSFTRQYGVTDDEILIARTTYVSSLVPYPPNDAISMVVDGSITNNPVFDVNGAAEMMNSNAMDKDVFLALAKHVPAVSSPVGGKPVVLGNRIENHDLNLEDYRNGWGRDHAVFEDSWLHSDMKDVAYFYVFKLYEQLVQKGNLK